MKKRIFVKAAAFCMSAAMAAGLLSAVPAGGVKAEGSAAKAIAMYRIFSPVTGEHFYTASTRERDYNVANGWVDEGIGWYAPETSNSPVYRLHIPGGDHHYTMQAKERDYLVANGWTDEGIGWYSDDNEAVPLYRVSAGGRHNYTTQTRERDYLVVNGWTDEGIGWYGVENKIDPKEAKVGDIVKFGSYEQDNDLTNGAEPIEWEVIDIKDGHKLLLSKYVLDSKPFEENENFRGTNHTQTAWENSSIRYWLNNDFYDTAFSQDEQKNIMLSHNLNLDTYPIIEEVRAKGGVAGGTKEECYCGEDTDDKVFLLSWDEVSNYFFDNVTTLGGAVGTAFPDEQKYNLALGKPTKYAVTTRSLETNGENIALYWLRSVTQYGRVAYLIEQGQYMNAERTKLEPRQYVNYGEINQTGVGIRPAILLK